MLNELEKKVIASIQEDIPINKNPYLGIAEKLGIKEDLFYKTLKELSDKGIIRRFGATIRHQKSGFASNAMVAWKVAEDMVDEVGQKSATFKQVSHCYVRNPKSQWPYNLYTMVHGETEEDCRKIVEKMSRETGINDYAILFSRKELKKSSMQYFKVDNKIET